MKRHIIILLIILLMSVLQAEVVDKIIARVGNDIILLSDLIKQINQMKSAKMLPEGTKESDILAQMIESRLIIQKAKDLGYTIDEAKIKSAVDKQIRQIKARFESEEEYTRELRKMKLTNSDLVKYFTDTFTEQSLSQKFYQNQIQTKVTVSETELRAFYEARKDTLAVKPVTYEIGMIIRQAEASEATDKAQLDAIKVIQSRLKNGEDFATLAGTDSQCPSREQGGDLGFFKRGAMVKAFDDAAFALNVGEISDIVKTQYGYHLIKLEEKKGEEIRVRHILRLVEPSSADSLAVKQLMEDIRSQYVKSGDFATLASKWSQDKDSAKDGGSIGEYGDSDYPELFAPVLSALTVGGISEVLENEGTYYLFSKLREIPGRVYSFEEVRSQINEVLSRQKAMKVYDDWVNQLKIENYVEILL